MSKKINAPVSCSDHILHRIKYPGQVGSSDAYAAKAFLASWAARAKASRIAILIRLANTLLAHQSGILAYFDYPISTGPLEGTNNKIKTLQKQAYGFRDMDFFKLKIMAPHEAKYALVG